jgi:hypothetical protein
MIGPAPILPVTQPEDPALGLRINQRIAAEVMRINGDRVVIAVQGVPIVAQLASSEQAAVLVEHQQHTFVVQEASAGKVLLRLLQPAEGRPAGQAKTTNASRADWLATLLQQIGVASTPGNIQLAQAMLAHRLPISAEGLNELRQALISASSLTGDSSSERIQAAVWLKSRGIPITAGSLELAEADWPSFSDHYAQVLSRLRLLAGRTGLPDDLGRLVRQALEAMEKAVVRLDLPAESLAGRLRLTAGMMGQSVENELLHLLLDRSGEEPVNAPLQPERFHGSLLFSHLQGELARHGHQELADLLRDMLDYLRWLHLLSQDVPDTGATRWAVLEIPVVFAASGSAEARGLSDAQLRIAYGSPSGGTGVDPGYTRLLIQVDLPADGDPDARPGSRRLQVDLSLYRQLVRACVTLASPDYGDRARAELPGLAEGLQALGYTLQSASVQVGALDTMDDLHPPPVVPVTQEGVDVDA